MTSKIKDRFFKLFQNVAFIVIFALLYFYSSKLFGPFQILSVTFFTLEQVKVLLGVAIIYAIAYFYGPVRGIFMIVVGECLVQWKLIAIPQWWFVGVYPLFLLPLFFIKSESTPTRYARFGIKITTSSSLGALAGVTGFFLLGLLGGVPFKQLVPQWGAFVCAAVVTFIPMTIVLAVIFTKIRQPREIFNQALTHHSWEDRDHTITFRFGGLSVHFCTRCTGMVLGVIVIFLISDLFPFVIAPELALLLCILLPAPGLFIWSVQKFGFWKDKTPSRLVNGAALGIAIYMLTQTRPLFVEMTVIMVIYFAIFYGITIGGSWYQRKKQQEEIEELMTEIPEKEEEKPYKSNEEPQNP